MDKETLLRDLKGKRMSVEDLCLKLAENNCPIAVSTFYKKLRGISEFTLQQIKTIAKVMDYSNEKVLDIFFSQQVS